MTFGETLKKIRKEKGKSQKDLADLMKIDYGYLSRLENDKVQFIPSREFILKIVEKLLCDEADKDELLKEANRVDKEMEQIARETNVRPELKPLFRGAVELSDEDLRDLNKTLKQMLKKKSK